MFITCPHCFAKFKLPDDQITEDIRLRCSFCDTVFPLHDGQQQVPSTIQPQESFDSSSASQQTDSSISLHTQKKRTPFSVGVILFLVLFAIVGAWVVVVQYQKESKREQKSEDSALLAQEQIKALDIKDYRQYFITNNPNIQTPFVVIEGKIKNNSKESKAFVVVKASLLNDKGDVIVEQEMLAGVALSLFQLQTMKEENMIELLKDPLEIAVTNSNVLPQNEVPFMILFFNPPREATEFIVQIVSATKAQELS